MVVSFCHGLPNDIKRSNGVMRAGRALLACAVNKSSKIFVFTLNSLRIFGQNLNELENL